MTIGIIGGGIAGLASAIALAKIGKSVDLYEKAEAFGEVGAGLQIGPNAVSALKQLGVFDALEPLTVAPQNIRIMDGVSGKTLSILPLGDNFEKQFGQPYRVAHRADLLTVLVDKAKQCPNVKIHLASPLARLDIEPDNITCHFTNSNIASHQMLIGADGFRSIVRRSVLNDGPPIFAGHSLYRALIPIENAPNISHINDVHLWMYPGGHVVHYPVSAGKNLNIVAASEQNWESRDWSTPADPPEVKEYFAKACYDLHRILKIPKGWLKWAAAGHPASTVWHKHQAVLVGDAIHPTLPYLAQGAAMALEDAVCLASAISKGQSVAEFANTRQERTAKIVTTSARQGTVYHLRNPKRLARNIVIRTLSADAQLNRLSWLYNWSAPEI